MAQVGVKTIQNVVFEKIFSHLRVSLVSVKRQAEEHTSEKEGEDEEVKTSQNVIFVNQFSLTCGQPCAR